MEAAALTGAQRAGLACVLCGVDFTGAPIPSRPVGKVREGQVFACTTHDEEPGEEPSGDMQVPGWYAPPAPVRQDDGMDEQERMEVLATPHELLRAACGHPIVVGTPDGREVTLRLPSVEEFRAAVERGRQWHIDNGLSVPDPPSDEQIASVVKPLDL